MPDHAGRRPSQVLIVCTGNICRSPMAQGFLRRHLADLGFADEVRVISAGCAGLDGHGPSRHATEVMEERGIDISAYQARSISLQDIDSSDLILVMEEHHRRSVFLLRPESLSRVFLLSEMVGRQQGVADPYGLPIEAYRECADGLERVLSDGIQEIVRRLVVMTS